MPATKTYKLPPHFYADHRERGCGETGRVVRSVKSYVVVELDAVAFDDLRSDCECYVAYGSMGERDFGMIGLAASARATLKRLLADPLGATPVEKRRFVFRNPGPGYPLTIRADATDEASARRIIAADLPHTRTWPLDEGSN